MSKDYNSLRPYAIDGDLKRRTINVPRYANMPIVKAGVSYHYSEVNTESKLIFKFLRVSVNFQGMTLNLTIKKERKIQEQCKKIQTLNKLTSRLASSSVVILSAPLPYQALQHQQIQEMHSNNCLEEKITLSEQAKGAFDWQLQNLNMYNLKSLITPPAQLKISSDSSSQDWEVSCQWQ